MTPIQRKDAERQAEDELEAKELNADELAVHFVNEIREGRHVAYRTASKFHSFDFDEIFINGDFDTALIRLYKARSDAPQLKYFLAVRLINAMDDEVKRCAQVHAERAVGLGDD